MKERICPSCGQPIPQPEGRLICSQCGAPILKGQRWTHGGDGRPKHRDCLAAQLQGQPQSPLPTQLLISNR